MTTAGHILSIATPALCFGILSMLYLQKCVQHTIDPVGSNTKIIIKLNAYQLNTHRCQTDKTGNLFCFSRCLLSWVALIDSELNTPYYDQTLQCVILICQ